MALTGHISAEELGFLGERLAAAHETLYDRFVAPHTEAEQEDALGSETLGAFDTVRDVADRLIPAT